MDCVKCAGTGMYKHFGECNDCKGSGDNAKWISVKQISFQNKTYHVGDEVNFINNAGNPAIGVIDRFRRTEIVDGDNIPIRIVWMFVINIKTKKEVYYPLWKSISIITKFCEK